MSTALLIAPATATAAAVFSIWGARAIRERRARKREMPSHRPGKAPSRRPALQARAQKAEAVI